MARFDTSGLDDIIQQMQRMKADEGPAAEEMVNAATEEIKKEWQLSAYVHGHVKTGAMVNSIEPAGSAPVRAGNVIYRDVYPQGSDEKGTRNATKAFILNYGRSNLPGTYWVKEAEENSAGAVVDICTAIWNEFIAEHS